VQLHVNVEVGVDGREASRLVPRLRAGIVARPCLETNDASLACETFGLAEELGGHALLLLIRVNRKVPDHAAQTGSILAHGSQHVFALDVDEANDLVGALGNELDRGTLVALFRLTDVIEERGVEERENAALEPTSLVAVSIRTDRELMRRVPNRRTGSGSGMSARRYPKCGTSPSGRELLTAVASGKHVVGERPTDEPQKGLYRWPWGQVLGTSHGDFRIAPGASRKGLSWQRKRSRCRENEAASGPPPSRRRNPKPPW
jgi:hypothetical protein